MINAGFVCFARDGYKKTAMSEVAAMAGVSKPSLFHYFGTKRDFYLYLFRFSCDAIGANITAGGDDFFECIALATRIKVSTIARYSGMYEFLISVVREDGEMLFDALRDADSMTVTNAFKTLFANVNWAKLKDGVTPEEALKLVTWISEGYIRENSGKETETIIAEVDRYLTFIKSALYKEEYL